MNIDLSIVFPAYNEEKNVEEAMRRVGAFMTLKVGATRRLPAGEAGVAPTWECLVVDDGSTDRTAELARKWIASQNSGNYRLISNTENRGKGAAARQGVLAAAGKFILLTDVDLSAPI